MSSRKFMFEVSPEPYGDGYYAVLTVDDGVSDMEVLPEQFGDTPLDALKNLVEYIEKESESSTDVDVLSLTRS